MSESLQSQIIASYYASTVGSNHSSTREHYETAAAGLRRWLKAWLPSNRDARCLDLASGCGELIYLLEREGFHDITGVDLCEEELVQARKYVKGELHQVSVENYLRDAEATSVDLVTALNILEHLDKNQLLAVLSNVRRILKPGGTLIALVPNAMSPFGSSTRYWDLTHEWAFTPGNFRQLARLAGFDELIDFRECSPAPHGLFSAVRYLLWQGLRALIAAWLLIEVGTARERVYTMNMLVRLHVPA